MENRLRTNLIGFVRTRFRVCPQPASWLRLQQLLERQHSSGQKSVAPPPPSLNASEWQSSSNDEKRARLEEQIDWAAANGDLAKVDSFLLELSDEEWRFSAPPDSLGKTITIMPDFGFGPYLWIKDTSDESEYVGECSASHGWVDDSVPMSPALGRDFDQWADLFETGSGKGDFDWEAFHARAIELCKRLKKEVGSRFAVQYCKPCEDPNHRTDEITKVP